MFERIRGRLEQLGGKHQPTNDVSQPHLWEYIPEFNSGTPFSAFGIKVDGKVIFASHYEFIDPKRIVELYSDRIIVYNNSNSNPGKPIVFTDINLYTTDEVERQRIKRFVRKLTDEK